MSRWLFEIIKKIAVVARSECDTLNLIKFKLILLTELANSVRATKASLLESYSSKLWGNL